MSHNTWIHRAVSVVVQPLTATPVTPNQVTTLRLITGLAAAALFLVSMFLDRMDGQLARLTGKTSPHGHTYDLVSDALCNALAFVGLGVGLRAGEFGYWSAPMGLAAGLAITTILWLVMRMEQLHGQRAAELETAAGFDADDALLVVPLLIWLGLAEWLLVAASLGAPVFALFMWIKFRADLRGPRPGR